MTNKYTQLTLKERYIIEILIQLKYSNDYIAKILGRHKSTISRELQRNNSSKNKGTYSGEFADKVAKIRCDRELPTRFNSLAIDKIKALLEDHWSPEQISFQLKKEDITKASHELIYQYIDSDRKNGGDLYKQLPCRGKKYKKRNIKIRKKYPEKAAPRKHISERGKKDILKTEIGHWEGDTVEGKAHKSGISTFVDMQSKYLIMRKLKDKTSEEMKNSILNIFRNGSEFIKTLTVDNGSEFAKHDIVSKELQAEVYFANPYSPWERGLNENTNGLIRKFYPKGTDFSKVSERELLKVQDLINERPRKTLGFKTPKEIFIKEVMKTNTYRTISRV